MITHVLFSFRLKDLQICRLGPDAASGSGPPGFDFNLNFFYFGMQLYEVLSPYICLSPFYISSCMY